VDVRELTQGFSLQDSLDMLDQRAKEFAASFDANFAAATKSIKENIKGIEQQIADARASLLSTELDLAEEISRLSPGAPAEGSKEAWHQQLALIESYKEKAAVLWDAGKIEQYQEYVRRIKALVEGLPEGGIKQEADEGALKRRETYLKKMIKHWAEIRDKQGSTQGRYTYNKKVKETKEELRKLRQEQKDGGKEIVSAEEMRAKKLEQIKSIYELVIQAEQKRISTHQQAIKDQEEQLSRWNEEDEAITAIMNTLDYLQDKRDEITARELVNLSNLIDKAEELRKKRQEAANALNSSGGSGGSDSGRAQPNFLGGPVSAGSKYLVGERGPELFVPNTDGKIVPNDKIGGSFVTVDLRTNSGDFSLQATMESVAGLVRKQERMARRAS
jgi:hypothetical protein